VTRKHNPKGGVRTWRRDELADHWVVADLRNVEVVPARGGEGQHESAGGVGAEALTVQRSGAAPAPTRGDAHARTTYGHTGAVISNRAADKEWVLKAGRSQGEATQESKGDCGEGPRAHAVAWAV
jgi:hypothetical protein